MDAPTQREPAQAESNRVLAIDDDPVSLRLLAVMLERAGYRLDSRPSGNAALEFLQGGGADAFWAVLTDFQMPGMSGADVLEAVRELDPSLATVVMTGAGERGIVSASLRGGAVEFLDKPFDPVGVVNAVRVACAETARRRALRAGSARLQEIASLQHRMIPRLHNMADQFPRIVTRFFPINEAGGDFVTVAAVSAGRIMVGLGDVSGHGVKEGFLAAHLQGIVKGMALSGVPARVMVEKINRFLLREWASGLATEIPTSLCVALATLDLDRGEAEIVNCGCPSPVVGTLTGQDVVPSGTPLGWFEVLEPSLATIPIPAQGSCYLWSDGLEFHAEEVGVAPLSLAHRILTADEKSGHVVLAHRRDDILVCRIDWQPRGTDGSPIWLPFVSEKHPGNGASRIDSIQAGWERSLRLVLPRISDRLRCDILVCAREALLNAFVHGCCGDQGLTCRVVFEASASGEFVRVAVHDEGGGVSSLSPPAGRETGHLSLGLRMIDSIAGSVVRHRRGASIEMEFRVG